MKLSVRFILVGVAVMLAMAWGSQGSAQTFTITDIIPNSMSADTNQNSEPNIAVDPLNPSNIVVSSFGAFGSPSPFFGSTDGGLTWTNYASISHGDASMDWLPGGSPFVAYLQPPVGNNSPTTVNTGTFTFPGAGTYNNIAAGQQVNANGVDQPWAFVANANNLYVSYENYNNAGASVATVRYSNNGGVGWTNATLDQAPGTFGNGAAVRVAGAGNVAYAAYEHFTATTNMSIVNTMNGPITNFDFVGNIVVSRDNAAGTGGFNAFGASGTSIVSNVIIPYNTTAFGQERLGSDLSIAVNPNNSNVAAVAYTENLNGNDPGVFVVVTTNGGASWDTVLLSKHSAMPALTFAANGALGLLYVEDAFVRGSTNMAVRFQQAGNPYNLAGGNSTVLANFATNAIASQYDPWLGDWFDLTSVSNTFFGSFAAPNIGDTNNFPLAVGFQRSMTTNLAGVFMPAGGIAPSIDPYVFSTAALVPEPSTWLLVVIGVATVARWRRRQRSS